MAENCGAVCRLKPNHLIGLSDQLRIMGADQHQPLAYTLLNHTAHLSSCLGIQKRRGFIEHLHGQVAQPGAQQPEPVNFAAGEGILG